MSYQDLVNKSAQHVNSALITPERDAAYRENNTDYRFQEWMNTPGAREYYEDKMGYRVQDDHWSLQSPPSPQEHYRLHGRGQGHSYIHPEVRRTYGPAYDFQAWMNQPGAQQYYEAATGERVPDGHWSTRPVGSPLMSATHAENLRPGADPNLIAYLQQHGHI